MNSILVAGASGDIGRAIVRTLLDDGFEVICHYFSSDIEDEFHDEVTYLRADLSKSELTIKLPPVDGFIYAAGTAQFNLLQDETSSSMDALYHLHVKSLMQMTQQLLPSFLAQQQGRIIVISSIWGETGAAMEVVYSAMKAAQIGYVKALAKELALTGVTVNAVSPGLVRGKMTDALPLDAQQDILDEIPQGEMIEPIEIAELCKFLLSKHAQHITGQVLRINGGWLI